jgi:ATP diphosphatase
LESFMKPSRDIETLLAIMARLRTPVEGCPWDLEQDFASIAPCAIEEAYEVVDAIERNDFIDLREELGDLLLQVVFHAQMAQEKSLFDFGGVVQAITTKLIRRHPHVFGDARDLSPDEVAKAWTAIKQEEKAERAAVRAALRQESLGSGNKALAPSSSTSVLAGVPHALPALTRALKLQQKASKVGFDWNDARLVLAKIREECDELERELDAGDNKAAAGEIGDLIFAMVNLARHCDADAEEALRGTNAKFERRFGFIESELDAQGRTPALASLEEMDALWDEAKRRERE